MMILKINVDSSKKAEPKMLNMVIRDDLFNDKIKPDVKKMVLKKKMLLDGGAQVNVVSSLDKLNNVRKLVKPERFEVAAKKIHITATHAGDLVIMVENKFGKQTEIMLTDVYYTPELALDIIYAFFLYTSKRKEFVSNRFATLNKR